jgi:CubicO group peptidase (beta-lactamase class C family)
MKILSDYRQSLFQKVFRTVDVPRDLAGVTDIDEAGEADPALGGLEQAAVDEIWEACQNLYRSGVHPLLSICLRRRGQVMLNRSLGHVGAGRVASVNTPICLFSASKAVSAVLLHLLAEQGKINLLDPVSYYIPEFAARGKGSISILQMLAHRGGVPSLPQDFDINLLFDHAAALELICAAQPQDHQGRIQAYHAITSGFIVDELIRVTTGLNAQQYLDRYIRKPLGMRYFRYGLTRREQARAAVNTSTGIDSALINRALGSIMGAHPDQVVELSNDPRFFKAVIPSGNLFATAEEVSRFFQMLLNHGEWQGRQILQPLTVHRATRSVSRTELDKSLMMPMRYSAGFMLGSNPVGIFGTNSQYAYGHLGFANIFVWADPERDISVAVMNTGKTALGPHLKTLPALLGAISAQCTPLVDMDSDEPIYRRRA